ncbi:unnamed protein product [Cochlearia groenlandica]
MKSGAKWIGDDDGDGGDSRTEPTRCRGGSEARWEWTSQAIDGRIARYGGCEIIKEEKHMSPSPLGFSLIIQKRKV